MAYCADAHQPWVWGLSTNEAKACSAN